MPLTCSDSDNHLGGASWIWSISQYKQPRLAIWPPFHWAQNGPVLDGILFVLLNKGKPMLASGINTHGMSFCSTTVSSNLGSHVIISDLLHQDKNNYPNNDLTELILLYFLNIVWASNPSDLNTLFTAVFQAQHLLLRGKHVPLHVLPFRAVKRSIRN